MAGLAIFLFCIGFLGINEVLCVEKLILKNNSLRLFINDMMDRKKTMSIEYPVQIEKKLNSIYNNTKAKTKENELKNSAKDIKELMKNANNKELIENHKNSMGKKSIIRLHKGFIDKVKKTQEKYNNID